MKKKKKSVKLIACCSVAAIVAASLMGAASLGKNEEIVEETDTRIMVQTAAPGRGNLVVTGEYIGTVEPNQQVAVYPKSAGEVLYANFTVGDKVEEGDVLCELDSTALKYTISQTQASIASAKAKADLNLEITKQTVDTYNANLGDGTNSALIAAQAAVRAAENGLETANVALRTARRNYNDAKDDDEYYTDSQIDGLRDVKRQAEITQEKAQLALEQAEESLRAVEAQIRDQAVSNDNSIRVAELNTDLDSQYIALEKLQNDLRDAVITAPISGIIEKRNVDPHDVASTMSAVYVISNKDLMTVSFKIPEASLAHVRQGDTVTLDKNGQTCTGTITEIATMADSISGLFTVKASVENVPFELRTGSTVKIYADTKKADNCMLIPIDALYYDSGKAYVYIVEDGLAKRVYVETGISNEEQIQIISGLDAAMNVITTWNSKLADGASVALVGEEQTEPADSDTEAAPADAVADAPETEAGAETDEADAATSSDVGGTQE